MLWCNVCDSLCWFLYCDVVFVNPSPLLYIMLSILSCPSSPVLCLWFLLLLCEEVTNKSLIIKRLFVFGNLENLTCDPLENGVGCELANCRGYSLQDNKWSIQCTSSYLSPFSKGSQVGFLRARTMINCGVRPWVNLIVHHTTIWEKFVCLSVCPLTPPMPLGRLSPNLVHM